MAKVKARLMVYTIAATVYDSNAFENALEEFTTIKKTTEKNIDRICSDRLTGHGVQYIPGTGKIQKIEKITFSMSLDEFIDKSQIEKIEKKETKDHE